MEEATNANELSSDTAEYTNVAVTPESVSAGFDAQWESPFRQRVRGTLLGDYLDSGRPRFLFAVMAMRVGYGCGLMGLVMALRALFGAGGLSAFAGSLPGLSLALTVGATAIGLANALAGRWAQAIWLLLVGGGMLFLRGLGS